VSLKRAMLRPGKDFMLKCRSTEYRCCLVESHEHNLLPFSTPQSYALLSAESKATEAANNKERLDEYHFFDSKMLRKVIGG
jgi:hypothetical protein